jgi:hypothetical protein
MRNACRVLALVMVSTVGQAATTGDGLQVRALPLTWQPWQARLVVNLPPFGWLSSTPGSEGAAIAGDHYFDWARFGSSGGFRATGALRFNAAISGSPVGVERFGQSVFAAVRPLSPHSPESSEPVAMPYLGMGYTAAWPKQGLGMSADLGLLAQRPGNAHWARLLSGGEGMYEFARATQIAPVLQVQLSYAF